MYDYHSIMLLQFILLYFAYLSCPNQSSGFWAICIYESLKENQMIRNIDLQEYFYGIFNELSPYTSTFNFSDIQIFHIGGTSMGHKSGIKISCASTPNIPTSTMTSATTSDSATTGADSSGDPTRAYLVTISKELLHCVLGVSFAKDANHLLTRSFHKTLAYTIVQLVALMHKQN